MEGRYPKETTVLVLHSANIAMFLMLSRHFLMH